MFGTLRRQSDRFDSVGRCTRSGRVLGRDVGRASAWCSLGPLATSVEKNGSGIALPMYEMVISSPSLMGSSALKNACLPSKLTAAFGVQEWLHMARVWCRNIPAWPVSTSVLSKEFVCICIGVNEVFLLRRAETASGRFLLPCRGCPSPCSAHHLSPFSHCMPCRRKPAGRHPSRRPPAA